jgi:3-oxoacyl-[acyl-carrier-protein] synthase-1
MRAGELEDGALFADDWGQIPPIFGHSVRGCTEGYTGLGRVTRLALLALEDLLRYPGFQPSAMPVKVSLNLSDGIYYREMLRRTPAGVPVGEPDDEAETDELRLFQQECGERLVSILKDGIAPHLALGAGDVSFGGHAGFVSTLRQGVDSVRSGALGMCIVGGIDSFVDPMTLGAITELGLRKHDEQPSGIIPGEAAAVLVLERHDHAVARGAVPAALLGGACLETEEQGRFTEARTKGRALARAIAGAFSPGSPRSSPMIGDLNGDAWRAYEWAMTLAQLPPALRSARLSLTAASLGEVGAAAGPIAVCMAVRALQRGYAGADEVLVWLSSESGSKGSILVQGID